MGYQTKFDIHIEGTIEKWVTGVDKDGNTVEVNIGSEMDADDIIAEISDHAGYISVTEEPIKWHDHDGDMILFSEKYPNLLFTVYGEGETSDDMWCTYYQNGKSQEVRAKITYEPFDPAKLK